jgi:hypothetical protein
MKLRAEMLGPEGVHFYNLGGAVRSLADLEAWVNAVPADRMPKAIILEVDVWWLNENWLSRDLFTEGISGDHLPWQTHLACIREALQPRRVPHMAKLLIHGRPTDRIGIRAVITGDGFRRDGSQHTRLQPPTAGEVTAYLERKNRKALGNEEQAMGARGEQPSRLSRERLAALDRILGRLKARGVRVLGYSSAFTAAFVDAEERSPLSREAWREFHRAMPELFERHDFPFVSTPRTADLGGNDRMMWDAFHPNDTFHLYILRELLKDPRAAAVLPDCDKVIAAALASPKTNVWYPDLSLGESLMRQSTR